MIADKTGLARLRCECSLFINHVCKDNLFSPSEPWSPSQVPLSSWLFFFFHIFLHWFYLSKKVPQTWVKSLFSWFLGRYGGFFLDLFLLLFILLFDLYYFSVGQAPLDGHGCARRPAWFYAPLFAPQVPHFSHVSACLLHVCCLFVACCLQWYHVFSSYSGQIVTPWLLFYKHLLSINVNVVPMFQLI